MIHFNTIQEQLQDLDNQVFYSGLSEIEIQELQDNLQKKFPSYYYTFLQIFGFQQDFVEGLFINKALFLEHNQSMEDSDELRNYLMIGDNSGEDFWMIRTDDETDLTLYNWIDDEIEETGLTFADLIQHALEMRTDKNTFWETNENKYWNVQFEMKTTNENLLFDILGLVKKSNWKVIDEEISCSSMEVMSHDTLATILRKENTHTKIPTYTLSWSEPLLEIKNQAQIKNWENLLSKNLIDYTLSDFGISTAKLSE